MSEVEYVDSTVLTYYSRFVRANNKAEPKSIECIAANRFKQVQHYWEL